MRLALDALIAVTLVVLLACLLMFHRQRADERARIADVQAGLATLQQQMLFHGALRDVECSDAGFPINISPVWFRHGGVPTNLLAPGRQPWIDLAPPGDYSLHPPDPVITSPDQAGFWYNPNKGLFRARVRPQFTEQSTLKLYNRVNGVAVPTMAFDAAPDRKPQPMPLLQPNEVARRPRNAAQALVNALGEPRP